MVSSIWAAGSAIDFRPCAPQLPEVYSTARQLRSVAPHRISHCRKSCCCRRSPTQTRSSAPDAITAPMLPRRPAHHRRTRRSFWGWSTPWSHTISRWCARRSQAISITRESWPPSSANRAATSPNQTHRAMSLAKPASTTARSETFSSSIRLLPVRTSTRLVALGRGSLPVATENRIRAGADAAMGYPRFGMLDLLKLLGGLLVGLFRSHAAREAETAFLRQQLVVLKRSAPARLRLRTADRLIFVWLYRLFPSVREAAVVFNPETLVRWHRSGFRLYWRWKSRRGVGRPAVSA